MIPTLKNLSECAVCGSSELEEVVHLPNLPATDTYVSIDQEKDFSGYDLDLELCPQCQHLQLKQQLDPERLYTLKDYHFRASLSAVARGRNNTLRAFLEEACPGKVFDFVLLNRQ